MVKEVGAADRDVPDCGEVCTRPLRPDDYPAVQEIIARSFEDHVRQNRGGLEEYARETWYDPDHLLVAEVDGRVVGQMGVRDGVLWIEGAKFPAGHASRRAGVR